MQRQKRRSISRGKNARLTWNRRNKYYISASGVEIICLKNYNYWYLRILEYPEVICLPSRRIKYDFQYRNVLHKRRIWKMYRIFFNAYCCVRKPLALLFQITIRGRARNSWKWRSRHSYGNTTNSRPIRQAFNWQREESTKKITQTRIKVAKKWPLYLN